jgi:hypothetical protein
MMRAVAQARRWPLTLVLALAFTSVPAAVHARVYTCEDEGGRVILRDVPCKRSEIVREQEVNQEAPPAARAPESRAQPKQSQKLTEALVRELAQNVDAAFARRDLKQLLVLLAGDAVFEMEYRLPSGVQILRYNKEEYTGRLREGFKLGAEYTYQRERTDIVLSPGEQHAEIAASARQSFWFDNQWQPGATRNRWSVEMREGRPQITLLRAVVTALEQP